MMKAKKKNISKNTFPTNLNTIKMINEIRIENIYLHHGVGGLGGEGERVCLMVKLGVSEIWRAHVVENF